MDLVLCVVYRLSELDEFNKSIGLFKNVTTGNSGTDNTNAPVYGVLNKYYDDINK